MSNLNNQCSGCGLNLGESGSVSRRYSGIGGEVVRGMGHYDTEGDFEPDEAINLPDGAQTNDGDDMCAVCGRVVG